MTAEVKPMGMQEFDLPENHGSLNWLPSPVDEPAVAIFQAKYGSQMSDPEKKTSAYATIPSSTHAALRKATNDLHAMFTHATQHVCENPRYWKSFGFPDHFWKRAIESFFSGSRLLMGRFDFSVTPEMGIKCYEYNADSASGLFEGGCTQNAWAVAAGLGGIGVDGGIGLAESMVKGWQSFFPEGTLVHCFFDTDTEEQYHATYVMSLATKAGLKVAPVCGRDVKGLSFDQDGHVLDEQKRPIQNVWKTWSYATLLDLWDGEPLRTSGTVRLIDVCLNESITVLEPFWSAIPASKAILPVLWELYPNHPNLLLSTFTLTDELRKDGYVSKPVLGRCGENVELHLPGSAEAAQKTEGKFASNENVYQELCPLPKLDGQNVQCNAFVVAGHYAGTLVRMAEEPILGYNSECVSIRIIEDGTPLPTSGEVSGTVSRKQKRQEGEHESSEGAKKSRHGPTKKALPLGTVLGITASGITAYCSQYETVDTSVFSSLKHEVGKLYYGFRYQCVEFARRYLIHTQGITFGDVDHAEDIFDLPTAETVNEQKSVAFQNIPNGSETRPQVGALIIWARAGEFAVSGHVAIVVGVSDTHVRVAEQNVTEQVWGAHDYARELPVRQEGSAGFFIEDPMGQVRGWKNLGSDFQPVPVPIVLDAPEAAAQRKFLEAKKA